MQHVNFAEFSAIVRQAIVVASLPIENEDHVQLGAGAIQLPCPVKDKYSHYSVHLLAGTMILQDE